MQQIFTASSSIIAAISYFQMYYGKGAGINSFIIHYNSSGSGRSRALYQNEYSYREGTKLFHQRQDSSCVSYNFQQHSKISFRFEMGHSYNCIYTYNNKNSPQSQQNKSKCTKIKVYRLIQRAQPQGKKTFNLFIFCVCAQFFFAVVRSFVMTQFFLFALDLIECRKANTKITYQLNAHKKGT